MPTLTALLSKLDCSSSKRKSEWQELPASTENDELIEFRSRGQDVLRELLRQECDKPLSPVDAPRKDKVDWQAVLAKASELQKEEEDLHKKRSHTHQKVGRLKMLKRAMERRMQDNAGSFSANLKTYPEESKNSSAPFMNSHSRSGAPTSRRVDSGGQIIFCSHSADDWSRCSASTRSVITMHVIEEELEYM